MPRKRLALILLLFMYLPDVFAADAAREKYWADTLVSTVSSEQINWLEASGNKFLSLYIPDQSGLIRGGAILLHSAGTHPDWSEVISPVRKALPDYGWPTLSIQLPVLTAESSLQDYGAVFDEAPPRINAAIAFLQSNGISNIVLIGHDLGAAIAAAYLAGNQGNTIKGFIGISMISYRGVDPRFHTPESLAKITLPILDIYGSRDLNNVIESAQERGAAAREAVSAATSEDSLDPFRQSATAQAVLTKKTGFISYRQIEITGAPHSFAGYSGQLSKRIVGWLKNHAGGITTPEPAKR